MDVVAALRQQSHAALHLQEQDLGDMPDPEILAKARAEGRILLTHDLVFGEIRARSPSSLRTRRSGSEFAKIQIVCEQDAPFRAGFGKNFRVKHIA